MFYITPKNINHPIEVLDLVIGEIERQESMGLTPSFADAIARLKESQIITETSNGFIVTIPQHQTAKEITHNLLPTITKKES